MFQALWTDRGAQVWDTKESVKPPLSPILAVQRDVLVLFWEKMRVIHDILHSQEVLTDPIITSLLLSSIELHQSVISFSRKCNTVMMMYVVFGLFVPPSTEQDYPKNRLSYVALRYIESLRGVSKSRLDHAASPARSPRNITLPCSLELIFDIPLLSLSMDLLDTLQLPEIVNLVLEAYHLHALPFQS